METNAESKLVDADGNVLEGVTVRQDANGKIVELNVPETWTDDQIKSLQEQVNKGDKILAQTYEENQRKNQYKQEFEALTATQKAEIETLKKKLETLENGHVKPEPVADKIQEIHERLGVSEEELDDYALEHPAQYRKASNAYNVDVAKANAKIVAETIMGSLHLTTQQQTAELVLEQRIVTDGANASDVRAFSKHYGMPFTEKAYDLYKQTHSEKKGAGTETAKQILDSGNVTIVRGGNTGFQIPKPGTLTTDELAKLSPEQLDEYVKQVTK